MSKKRPVNAQRQLDDSRRHRPRGSRLYTGQHRMLDKRQKDHTGQWQKRQKASVYVVD